MITTESGTPVYGDWRSGHGGADRKSHMWIFHPFETRKRPACGVRRDDKAGRVQKRKARDLCSDCLGYSIWATFAPEMEP